MSVISLSFFLRGNPNKPNYQCKKKKCDGKTKEQKWGEEASIQIIVNNMLDLYRSLHVCKYSINIYIYIYLISDTAQHMVIDANIL